MEAVHRRRRPVVVGDRRADADACAAEYQGREPRRDGWGLPRRPLASPLGPWGRATRPVELLGLSVSCRTDLVAVSRRGPEQVVTHEVLREVDSEDRDRNLMKSEPFRRDLAQHPWSAYGKC